MHAQLTSGYVFFPNALHVSLLQSLGFVPEEHNGPFKFKVSIPLLSIPVFHIRIPVFRNPVFRIHVFLIPVFLIPVFRIPVFHIPVFSITVRPISGRGPTTPWPPLVNACGICRAAGKRNKYLNLISAFVMFADLK